MDRFSSPQYPDLTAHLMFAFVERLGTTLLFLWQIKPLIIKTGTQDFVLMVGLNVKAKMRLSVLEVEVRTDWVIKVISWLFVV